MQSPPVGPVRRTVSTPYLSSANEAVVKQLADHLRIIRSENGEPFHFPGGRDPKAGVQLRS